MNDDDTPADQVEKFRQRVILECAIICLEKAVTLAREGRHAESVIATELGNSIKAAAQR